MQGPPRRRPEGERSAGAGALRPGGRAPTLRGCFHSLLTDRVMRSRIRHTGPGSSLRGLPRVTAATQAFVAADHDDGVAHRGEIDALDRKTDGEQDAVGRVVTHVDEIGACIRLFRAACSAEGTERGVPGDLASLERTLEAQSQDLSVGWVHEFRVIEDVAGRGWVPACGHGRTAPSGVLIRQCKWNPAQVSCFLPVFMDTSKPFLRPTHVRARFFFAIQ